MPNSAAELIEQDIGYKPHWYAPLHYQNFTISATNRPKLITWLILNGIPKREAEKALDESLRRAYTSHNYLSTWRQRVNPKWNNQLDLNEWSHFDSRPSPLAIKQFGNHLVPPAEGGIEQQVKPNGHEFPILDGENNSLPNVEKLGELIANLVQQKLNSNIEATKRQLENKISENQLRHKADIDLITNRILEMPQKVQAWAETFVKEELAKRQVKEILIRREAAMSQPIDLGIQHKKFELLLNCCQARRNNGTRLNIWLTGPTGSGKTSAAENVAKALQLPFASDGSLDADFKVLGFRDANGNINSTEFLRVFASGGIYCADEIDNWLPSALLSLNSALANNWVSTPGGLIQRHKDFICIACANTWGLGANSDYVGRAKLDAASLDRFRPKIDWPIDEDMEMAISKNKQWCQKVQQYRARAATMGLKIIISPRATFDGEGLLAMGLSENEVLELSIFSGLSEAQKRSLTK